MGSFFPCLSNSVNGLTLEMNWFHWRGALALT